MEQVFFGVIFALAEELYTPTTRSNGNKRDGILLPAMPQSWPDAVETIDNNYATPSINIENLCIVSSRHRGTLIVNMN
jgi:hypothetical protein